MITEKKFLSLILTLAMVITIIPVFGSEAYATGTQVSYLAPEYNTPDVVTSGVLKMNTAAKVVTDDYIITASTSAAVTWGVVGTESWYVISGKGIELSGGVIIKGDVNLILIDDCSITVSAVENTSNAGIDVGWGNTLSVYAQSTGAAMGSLVATGACKEEVFQVNTNEYRHYYGGAGIGGSYDSYSNGNITINGGRITAIGGSYSAGIGGGSGYKWGMGITINDGVVTATGGWEGAGIGGGGNDCNSYSYDNYGGFGSDITINGGTVNATGGYGYTCGGGAGIGGGTHGNASNITINGGTITATGGSLAAGIGGGYNRKGTNIRIEGGRVYAAGGNKDPYDNQNTVLSSAIGDGGGYGQYVFGTSSAIYVNTGLYILAGASANPSKVVKNTGADLASKLKKQYVTITPDVPDPSTNSTVSVNYRYPEYTDSDPSKGISLWKDGTEEVDFVTSSDSTWGESGEDTWYVVTGSAFAINNTVVVNGNVNLILTDGCSLTVTSFSYNNPGIKVSGDGNSLTVYAQSTGAAAGCLTVTGGDGAAGIGGGRQANGSNITISGGKVIATGQGGGAGIGGGNGDGEGGAGSNITINGGTVIANGNNNGSGIGGGVFGTGSNININGGNVIATGSIGGAGIGGGCEGFGTTITVNGGMVTATGAQGGAGIGGGNSGAGSYITVNGGTINATGKQGGAGIGGGCWCAGSNIFISGGAVNAAGLEGGAGIGKGYGSFATNVRVNVNLTLMSGADENPSETVDNDGSDLSELLTSPYVVIGSAAQAPEGVEVSYRYPVYKNNTTAAGIDHWVENATVSAIVIDSSKNTNNSVTWGSTGKDSWYIVSGTGIVLNGGIIGKGNVHIILADDCSLTITSGNYDKAGIDVSNNKGTLTIYAQSTGVSAGSLTVTGNSCAAGIGGDDMCHASNITINGGNVTATGGSGGGAGIGGGSQCSGSNLLINGGNVIATGGYGGAGIGAGFTSYASGIIINGGNVTATGGYGGAGIGAGYGMYGNYGAGQCANVIINGGTVTATGGNGFDDMLYYGEPAYSCSGAAIGRGGYVVLCSAPAVFNIKINKSLVLKVGDSANPSTAFANDGSDLAATLTHQYVTIESTQDPAEPEDISAYTVSVNSQTYSGIALEPAVSVTKATTTLAKDVDFTAEYANNKNAGTATVTVSGIGNYTGTKSGNFTILPAELTVIGTSVNAKAYDGTTSAAVGILGTLTGVKENDDVSIDTYVAAFESKDAANGKNVIIKYTLKGAQSGNYTVTDSATKADIEKADASGLTVAEIPEQTYTDGEIKPELTVKNGTEELIKNTDYTVSYTSNTSVGTASAIITGIGTNYTGTKIVEFAIVPEPVKYTVTFDAIGGAYVAPQLVTEGTKAIKPSDPTRPESIFKGWYSADGNPFDFNTAITGNITLTAKWILKETESAEITIGTDAVNNTTTKIKVDGDTGVKAGGLETIAKEAKYSNADKDVKIILVAESKSETSMAAINGSSVQTDAIKASAAAVNTSNKVSFLAITLEKHISGASVESEELITDTGVNIIEVIVPYNLINRTLTGVYRYHDGIVTQFTLDNTKSGAVETYYYENSEIHIFTTRFSTYAVSYTENTVQYSEEPVTRKPVAKVCPQDNTCVYARFTDADTKAWYHDGVHFCVKNAYMNGISESLFAPLGTLSRAMIVTILWNMEGQPAVDYAMSFKDVPANKWYTEATRWAQSIKVVEGYDEESFGPEDDVTREQFAVILYRYAKYKGYDVTRKSDLVKFTDAKDTSSWAFESIRWANAAGIINGRSETTIVPLDKALRAEAATMIKRLCDLGR